MITHFSLILISDPLNIDTNHRPSLSKSWPVQLALPLIKAAVDWEPGPVRGGGKEREEQN